MNPKWWEGPSRFVATYWWAILLLIVLAVAAYFTRTLWMPV